jgi:hypothetical protein
MEAIENGPVPECGWCGEPIRDDKCLRVEIPSLGGAITIHMDCVTQGGAATMVEWALTYDGEKWSFDE